MARFILASALASVALLSAGPALASQCPKLINQINTAAGNRFDAAAAEAEQLHKAGKHADSEKLAKEGLAKIGVK